MRDRDGRFAGVRAFVGQLRSLRLTIPLLFTFAALFVVGTLAGPRLEKAAPFPQAAARFVGILDLPRSPVFLAAAGLLVVNVVLCTWHRVRAGLRAAGGKRSVVIWLDAAVHFSLVVLIAGGLGKGLWGTVGTGYLLPGTPATTMYVAESDSDVPLGFSVLLQERRESHYPVRVKVGVRDAATGGKVALLEVVEGRVASLPEGRLALSVLEVRENPAAVVLLARSPAGTITVTLSLVAGADAVLAGPFRLAAAAWRRDIREVRARVRIIEGERLVQEGWLEVNGALSHRGVSLFLTSWGADEFGNKLLGVQYRRDPAAPIFWVGAILLSVALPPFVLVRRRPAHRQPPSPETSS